MNNGKSTLPQHVGIIMDGNRRWAKERGLPVWRGHYKGRKTIHDVAIHMFDRGITYLTLYAFSTENWQRSKDEIAQLMKIFLWMAKHEAQELHKRGVRLRVIGSRLRLGKALVKAIHEAEELTKDNTRGTLLICLDYGGQQEIVDDGAVAARHVRTAEINQPEPAIDLEYVDMSLATARVTLADAIEAALARIDFRLLARPDADQPRIGQRTPNPPDGYVNLDQVGITTGAGAARSAG